jgi:hypothetical protein
VEASTDGEAPFARFALTLLGVNERAVTAESLPIVRRRHWQGHALGAVHQTGGVAARPIGDRRSQLGRGGPRFAAARIQLRAMIPALPRRMEVAELPPESYSPPLRHQSQLY